MEKMSFREVREILDLIDESRAIEVRLELGGTIIHVKRRGHETEPAGTALPVTPRPAAVIAPSAGSGAAAAALPSSVAATTSPEGRSPAGDGPEGCVAVKAPLAGIFYSAPSPGAPPFVEVGQKVNANTDVCIIEVMKVMNNVKAGIAGEVVEIAAQNEAAVQYQSALVWIRPAT